MGKKVDKAKLSCYHLNVVHGGCSVDVGPATPAQRIEIKILTARATIDSRPLMGGFLSFYFNGLVCPFHALCNIVTLSHQVFMLE